MNSNLGEEQNPMNLCRPYDVLSFLVFVLNEKLSSFILWRGPGRPHGLMNRDGVCACGFITFFLISYPPKASFTPCYHHQTRWRKISHSINGWCPQSHSSLHVAMDIEIVEKHKHVEEKKLFTKANLGKRGKFEWSNRALTLLQLMDFVEQQAASQAHWCPNCKGGKECT